MAEWSIAAVLKTVEGNTSGGSNPSLSAESENQRGFSLFVYFIYQLKFTLFCVLKNKHYFWSKLIGLFYHQHSPHTTNNWMLHIILTYIYDDNSSTLLENCCFISFNVVKVTCPHSRNVEMGMQNYSEPPLVQKCPSQKQTAQFAISFRTQNKRLKLYGYQLTIY